MLELAARYPLLFEHYQVGIPYPSNPRQTCDLVVLSQERWSVEVKMARFRGDNGKPTDEMLMHLISPYEEDRSALTDCAKLAHSGFPGRMAVLIYGFDHRDKLLDPAIQAFEDLAKLRTQMSERSVASLRILSILFITLVESLD